MIWGWDCNDLGMGLQSFGVGLQSFGDGIAVIWGWDGNHLGMLLHLLGWRDARAIWGMHWQPKGCSCTLVRRWHFGDAVMPQQPPLIPSTHGWPQAEAAPAAGPADNAGAQVLGPIPSAEPQAGQGMN